ncbi:MAG TPA: monovalent cation/H+ antiporter complex subunit F [Pseudonocardiaceae bacterium]|nr:monovalent cation/H+ antiporter complex subunit F [Pseudonocardiaceae bacterium]
MNGWLVGAAVLLVVGMLPAVVVASRGHVLDRLAGLAMAGMVATLDILLLSEGYQRSSYVDAGLVLAALSLTGSLVFARLVVRQ